MEALDPYGPLDRQLVTLLVLGEVVDDMSRVRVGLPHLHRHGAAGQ